MFCWAVPGSRAPDQGHRLPIALDVTNTLVVPVAVLVGASVANITTAELARRTAEEQLATVLDGAPIAMLTEWCGGSGI